MSTKKPKKAAPLKPANPSASNPVFFSPCNDEQENYLSLIRKNTITICQARAGTGKTAVAIAAAIEAYRSGLVDRMVFTKPLIEAGGAKLGFLPGTLADKSMPYYANIVEELIKQAGKETYTQWVAEKVVQFQPIETLRGLTLDKTFYVVDEFQNVSRTEAKLIVSRIGRQSKIVITGDIKQSDLGNNNGLRWFWETLRDRGIYSLAFHTLKTVVRHGIVAEILDVLENSEEKED